MDTLENKFTLELKSYLYKPRKNGIPSILISQSHEGEKRQYIFSFKTKLISKSDFQPTARKAININKQIFNNSIIRIIKQLLTETTGYVGPVYANVSSNNYNNYLEFNIKTDHFLLKPVPILNTTNTINTTTTTTSTPNTPDITTPDITTTTTDTITNTSDNTRDNTTDNTTDLPPSYTDIYQKK